MTFETISLEQAKELINNGAVLVDVRSKEEYDKGHLDKSINIPHTEILKKAKAVLKDKKTPVVLYCSAIKRSKQAWDFLNYLEYENIYVIENANI